MTKYCVSYIGQVRYLECIQLHRDVYSGESNITAILNQDVSEKVKFQSRCKHSLEGNITEDQIKNKLSELNISDAVILKNKDFPLMETLLGFPCQLFYTIVKTVEKYSDYDFMLFLTTDLIFVEDHLIMKRIVKTLPINEPMVFCRIDEENFYPRIFILNNLAVQNIKANWQTALKMYQDLVAEGKDRNEFATRKLFEYCGVKIQQVDFLYALRFRPNMDFKNVVNKNYKLLTQQEHEYSDFKNIEIQKTKTMS